MSERALRLSALLTGKAKETSGVRVQELADLANRIEPDATYARNIALALRKTIAAVKAESEPCPPDEYLSDTEIRRRLDLALKKLLAEEIQELASRLLTGPKAAKAKLHYLKALVERQGYRCAEQAMLGRRFTILCEAVAARVQPGPGSGANALEGLYMWDWHPNLSHHIAAPHPGLLTRVCSALYRGVRHRVMAGFVPEEAAKERVSGARADLAQAAYALMQAYAQETGPWHPAGQPGAGSRMHTTGRLNDAALHLEQAKARYETECVALGEDTCHTMRMPTHRVRIYETAFLDALSGMSGDDMNLLGQYCAGLACEEPPPGSPLSHLVPCLRNALREERAIRAGAEVVHALVQYIARWESPSFAQVVPHGDVPQPAADIGVSRRHDTPLSLSSSSEAENARNALMDHIHTLNQRFRLRECPFGRTTHVWTMTDFVRAGVERLPAKAQHRLRDAICDPEWKLPESLAANELMLGIIRAFQPDTGIFSRARLRPTPGPA